MASMDGPSWCFWVFLEKLLSFALVKLLLLCTDVHPWEAHEVSGESCY
jgi:hypothetical protein